MRKSSSEIIRNLEMRVARLEKKATLKIEPRNESAKSFANAIEKAVVAVIGQQGQDRSSKKVLVGSVLLETEVSYKRNGYHSVGFTDKSINNLVKFLERTSSDFLKEFKFAILKRLMRSSVDAYAIALDEIVEAVNNING